MFLDHISVTGFPLVSAEHCKNTRGEVFQYVSWEALFDLEAFFSIHLKGMLSQEPGELVTLIDVLYRGFKSQGLLNVDRNIKVMFYWSVHSKWIQEKQSREVGE